MAKKTKLKVNRKTGQVKIKSGGKNYSIKQMTTIKKK